MRTILALTALAVAAPASGEVVVKSAHGFHLRHNLTVEGDAEAAYRRFTQVGSWWTDAHTYSGKASNMTLDAKVGGCFCEVLPSGGGVEHMRVAFADPGKRLLLTGSLGPLLTLATTGAMDVRFAPDGPRTKLQIDYRVAGFADGSAGAMAPVVDAVLAEQFARLAGTGN